MLVTPEGIKGRNPQFGRQYDISYFNANYAAFEAEEQVEIPGDGRVVKHFVDALHNSWKGIGAHVLKYEDISLKPYLASYKLKELRGQFGVVHAGIFPSQLELRDKHADIAIPYNHPTVSIDISKVIFPANRKEATFPKSKNPMVTPDIMGKSFTLLADFLQNASDQHNLPDMVYGLTHSRMGRLSQRWGFEISEKPFLPEVYEFIEKAGKDEIVSDPEDYADLQRVGNQVMVYQPVARFIDLHANSPK